MCVCVWGGGGPKCRSIEAGFKKWALRELDLRGSEKGGVTGCCEHGNEHMGWENFLIIFGTITFSREIVP